MDVSNSLNKMRLSPTLVAFLAASTTLGLSNSAKAQSAPAIPEAARSPYSPIVSGAPQWMRQQVVVSTSEPERIDVSSPEIEADAIAQIQDDPNSPPGAPPLPRITPGDQSTPLQTTPDTLQFSPPLSPQPELQVPTTEPPTAPTPEATPSAPSESTTPAPPDTSVPITPPPGSQTPGGTTADPNEARVLVAEVLINGVEGAIQNEVYSVIRTQPGRTTTRSQLQEDINAIFRTGYFSNVRAVPEDTPLGVRVTFEVQLNPALSGVNVEGTTVLPQSVIDEAFQEQYGSTINLNRIDEGIKRITQWYQDNGYVLAQVIDAPAVEPDGQVTIQVAEGVVENIEVQFINKDGDATDEQGNPIRGRTRDFIITREFETKPGEVFNRNKIERDLQRVFGLGIFEDVRLALRPSTQDPRKVVVVANVAERRTGSISAGAGISSASGLFGTVSYQQQNLGGNNQRLGAEIQVGQRELLFDLNFTDPWIGGDPFRTSYSVNLFRRRTISLVFDGGEREVELSNGDRPRVVRTGGGVSFTRPLNGNPYRRAEWTGSLGLQYQNVRITDADGDTARKDERGNDLSFSGTGKDDLLTLQFGVVQDRRNDALRPTQGSLLRLGTEQSIPVGSGSIFMNRLRGGYSFYVPTRLLRLTQGCQDPKSRPADCPQAFAFNVQAGTVIGDLPPYEAFALGGSNSVRGYDEGDLAAARSFVQASIEYRFPIFSIISGALFVDAATDFGSQSSVPGDPGGVRRKPGSGFGYGAGVRIQSPLGPIRIDFGLNDQGDSRLHFGIGERF
ncbi:BamA/TamA family outer membrane protein [Pantanalinema rosaneae CENA516]|uniref:BamA/TamA family outer membrane protein n=1 Tax=Pantanalinema rosaneae TaxID=1620701 RepID=UPI003D6F2852